MDKKAVMMMTIVKAIVVIALVAILFYFFVNFVIVGSESNEREICRSSILLAAKSKLLGKPLIESINCKTDYKTIKTDKSDDIKMEITNEMVDCWYQFGEHGKNFVDDWGGKKTFVFLCSRLDFKEGIKENTPEVKGFSEFWASKPLPFKDDISFFDYFYEGVPKNFNLTISTKEPVYIAFIGSNYNLDADLGKYTFLFPGAWLAGQIYNPDFYGNLYVGNSRNVLEFFSSSNEEENRQCINGKCIEEVTPCSEDKSITCGEDYWGTDGDGNYYTCCGRKSILGHTCKAYSVPRLKDFMGTCKGQHYHLVSNPPGVTNDCDWEVWQPCCNGQAEPDCILGEWRCDTVPCP